MKYVVKIIGLQYFSLSQLIVCSSVALCAITNHDCNLKQMIENGVELHDEHSTISFYPKTDYG